MEKYEVRKPKKIKPIKIDMLQIPGSKSMTNRVLILAALSKEEYYAMNLAKCDDTDAMLDCLRELGYRIEELGERDYQSFIIYGTGGDIPNKNATLNVRSSGTTARFLTAMLAVCGGRYTLEASEQMKKRPMKAFLDALKGLGVTIEYLEKEGHFPFVVASEGVSDTEITIDTGVSTQFASAMLLVSKVKNIDVHLTGPRVNGSYIRMTKEMVEKFSRMLCVIEPDVSAACYFYAMALVLRTKTLVEGVYYKSLQGDIQFLNIIKKLGGKVTQKRKGIVVDCRKVTEYSGIDIDMHDFSDQALTLAVIAVFAASPTTIRNIGHIRKQESDRVMAIKNELEKIGCKVQIHQSEGQTDVVIYPGKLHGAEIETYEDHRVAMSFAIAGLIIDGIVIKNPMCCRKTFENYFEILDKIICK